MTIQILNISKYRLRLPSKMIDEVNHKRLPWQGEIKFYLNIVLLKCRKYIDGLFCVSVYITVSDVLTQSLDISLKRNILMVPTPDV